jgi:hypothetical protein
MDSNTSRRIETGFSTLRKSTACAVGLFGIGTESKLFFILSQMSVSPVPIVDYKLMDDSMLLVKSGDGFVRFMKISDWTMVPTFFQDLPIDTEAEMLAKYVQKRRPTYFHPQACDIWLSIPESAAAGDDRVRHRGLVERGNADALSRAKEQRAKAKRAKVIAHR